MAHTLPDYTTKYKLATIFGQIDSGELAARLKSINTFDRRGNVIWMDDFEATVLHWNTTKTGTSSDVALDTTMALTGNQCVKLTGGTSASSTAAMYRALAYPQLGKLGLEMGITNVTGIDSITIYLTVYDGTNKNEAAIRYKTSTTALQYENSEGNFTDFATITAPKSDILTFHMWKMIADFEEGEYMRFILDNTTYDLAGTQYRTVANASAPFLYAACILVNSAGVTKDIYVDNVIITQNEL